MEKTKDEIDNKYDIKDEGDLVFSEELEDWVPKEKDLDYEKELDVNHNVSNINLVD